MTKNNLILPDEKPFVLTRENYFSQEASLRYMSNSQYKLFNECEAMAVAQIAGDWVEKSSTALLVGSYVHAWAQGVLREWLSEHPECLKKDLTLKADYVQADKMIATLEKDEFAMYVLEGQKEVVLTAEMFGCWWKIMIDSHNPEKRRNVDLKTTRSITDHVWSEEEWAKVSFVEKYGYVTGATIYSEVERIAHGRPSEDWLDFYIVAVSKEDVPDKEVISIIDPDRYRQELVQIEAKMPRILQVKAGEVEPIGCGKCDYCRSIKRLAGVIHYTEL